MKWGRYGMFVSLYIVLVHELPILTFITSLLRCGESFVASIDFTSDLILAMAQRPVPLSSRATAF